MAEPKLPSTESEPARDVEVHVPPSRAEPAPAGRGALAEGQPGSSGSGLREAHADGIGAGGVRELAHAFQANAEALEGMHEIQAQLATALQRGDRSELVLQSTQALNETFRNLTAIQRQMLTQMQEQQAASRRSPLIPLMLLGLLTVLLGGVYLIVAQLQQARPSMQELARVRDENERGRLEAYREGQTRGVESAGGRVVNLEDEIDRSRMRIQALEGERDSAKEDVDQLERAKRSVELERDDLAERVIHTQGEAVARKLVEDTAREQKGDLVVAQRRLEALEQDLQRERAEKLRYMQRLAAYGFGMDEKDLPFEVRYPDRETPAAGATAPEPSSAPRTGPIDLDPTPAAAPAARRGPEQPGAFTGPGAAPVASRPDGLGPPPAGVGDLPAPTVRSPDGSLDRSRGGSLDRSRDGRPDGRPTSGTSAAGAFPPPVPPTAEGAASARKPVPVAWRRELNPDPVLAGRVRTIVNRLLGAGARTTRSKSEWQITKIGGITQDLLGNVLLLQYDPTGRVLGQIEAGEVRIVADRTEKVVALILKNGSRRFGGRAEALPAEGARLIIAKGAEHVRAWRDSGLVMVQNK